MVMDRKIVVLKVLTISKDIIDNDLQKFKLMLTGNSRDVKESCAELITKDVINGSILAQVCPNAKTIVVFTEDKSYEDFEEK